MLWTIVTPEARASWDGTALQLRPGRIARRGAGRGRHRGPLAHLLRQHLQSGAVEGRRDEARDAGQILEEPAGGRADRAADPLGRQQRGRAWSPAPQTPGSQTRRRHRGAHRRGPRDARRAAARHGRQRARRPATRGAGLHALRPPPIRDPDGLRRGPVDGRPRLRRRAAGRQGGSGRANPSSGRRDRCSTGRSARRGSTAAAPMSPMR